MRNSPLPSVSIYFETCKLTVPTTLTMTATTHEREAVYLPPSDLATKYAAGIQRPLAVTPHASAATKGSTLIKSIEHFYVRPRWLFVRVETEGGVVGWGEGTLEGHTEAVQGSLDDIARR